MTGGSIKAKLDKTMHDSCYLIQSVLDTEEFTENDGNLLVYWMNLSVNKILCWD